jgi:hypothetical protein
MSMDNPPPFKGQPETGGTMRRAMDAHARANRFSRALSDYERRFPEARHIGDLG